MTDVDTTGTGRLADLYNNRCPDCGSDKGYWQRGSVADFDYVCEDCKGVFDGDTSQRRAEKPTQSPDKTIEQHEKQ